MIRSEFTVYRRIPSVESILVAGFEPVGRSAVGRLRSLTGAVRFASLYTPFNPDFVDVDELGLAKPNVFDWYYSSTVKPRLILVESGSQPSPLHPEAYYEVAGMILSYGGSLGCRLFAVLDGYKSDVESMYVYGSSRRLISEFADSGVGIPANRRVAGLPAIIVGLAGVRRIDAVCLLASFRDEARVQAVASSLLRLLLSKLKIRGVPGLPL